MRNSVIFPIIIIVLILIRFFGLIIFKAPNLNYLFFLIIIILSTYKVKTLNAKLIIAYIFFLTLSCVSSYFYHGQNILTVVIHSFPYYSILFYFVLVWFKPSYQEVERVLIATSLIFCFCYMLQWLAYPTVIFGGSEYNVKDEIYRARMPGSICGYFIFLYGINRLVLTRKYVFILFSILGFLPIIIQGFRVMIVLTLISTLILIPLTLKNTIKTFSFYVLGALFVFAAMNTNIVKSKMEEMERRQLANQTFKNKDYIRYVSFDYYWNIYYTKPYEKILGGGLPSDKKSKYSMELAELNDSHLWISDLGLVGISMQIGLPCVLCLIMLYLCCIYKCRSSSLQPIRFTLIVVLVGSLFTNSEIYRSGNMLILSLLLYMEYCWNHKKNRIVRYDRDSVSR